MFVDLTRLAVRNILRRKLRSALTLLGVLIGMTAIVALISIGQGIQDAFARQFARIGYDLILILPGVAGNTPSSGPRPLDITIFQSLDGAAHVGALVRQILPVQAGDTQGFLTIVGLSEGILPMAPSLLGGFELAVGRIFEPTEPQVILGNALAADLKLGVGQTLLIKNKEFSVVGVLKPSSGDDQNDSVILMSIDRLYGMTEEPHLVSLAVVKAREGTDVIHLSNRIEKTLASRGIRDFTVQSSQQLYDIIGNILRIVQVALASIAAIALLVGGIGLSNTMYTAVLERIREIGLFKSLGAKRHHILVLFLLESALLGFMGGLLGLIGGLSISQSVAIFASQAFPSVRFSAGISPELLLGSLLISVVLGAIAGLWPAMRAARLDPIEALRYE